jgi:hypothetical protein
MLRGNRDDDLEHFIFEIAKREFTTNDVTALRALSFFDPSATFEAWAEVAQLSRTELETTIDRLSALSLVNVLAGEERYALHPLTRNFVRDELLADEQITRIMGMSFAGYWTAYAQRHGGTADKNYKTFNLIEAEWSNLNSLVEWLWQAVDRPAEMSDKDAARTLNNLAVSLCSANGPLFFLGLWDQVLNLSVRAYKAMLTLGSFNEAGWRAYQATWIHYHRANMDEATRWADIYSEAWGQGSDRHIWRPGCTCAG